MTTNNFLLTWNPKKSNWASEGYNEFVLKTQKGELPECDWSCGNTKKIRVGARVYILRQGKDHPGLFGSGRVVRELHRVKSKWPWQVGVAWDVMLPVEKVLPREKLLKGLLSKTLVNSQRSGVGIDEIAANLLEKAWSIHSKRTERLSIRARAVDAVREGETVEQTRFVRKRDRQIRDQALDHSQGVCEVCGVDFSKKLEGKALRVLQVHHRKQLGWSDNKSQLTKPSDLAVVCANCHLLIHINPKEAMPIKALKAWIKKSW